MEKYWIQEAEADPHYGIMQMEWMELLDGPIEGYIKSEHFIVTDSQGNVISSAE